MLMQLYNAANGLEDRQPPDEISAPTSSKTITQNTQHTTIQTQGDGRSVFLFAVAHTPCTRREEERIATTRTVCMTVAGYIPRLQTNLTYMGTSNILVI